MTKYTINAQSRTIIGRKVKVLRKQGLLPGTIYGKDVKSVSIALPTDEFIKVYKQAGESGLVEVQLDGQKKPVLIHNVQINPVTDEPIHAELYQVNLKEKVHAKVPIEFRGSSPAVEQKEGTLLRVLDEVEIEALPERLLQQIEVDVSRLIQVDQEIKVKDLSIPGDVTMLTDPELTVVKIGALVVEEVAPPPPAEAEEAPAEGEGVPAEEASQEAEKQKEEKSAE